MYLGTVTPATYHPGMRRRPPLLTDEQILARDDWMDLLAAVAAGEVVRGAGRDESITAPYMWRGESVRMDLVTLRGEELVTMPISGPPVVAPRGERIITAGQDR